MVEINIVQVSRVTNSIAFCMQWAEKEGVEKSRPRQKNLPYKLTRFFNGFQ